MTEHERTEDEIWRAIDTQRGRVADLLDDLSDDEWRRPSLCDGWAVRDVAAHLTLQQATALDALAMLVREHSGPNAVIRKAAARKAAAPTDRLVAEIRAMIGSRRHNVGVTCREALIDALVHSQDIAVPLGRDLPVPPDAAAVAAARVWQRGWPFYPRRRLAGLRIRATDAQWVVGDGPEVAGPAGALLLLLTGRTGAAAPRLSGEGLDRLLGGARTSG